MPKTFDECMDVFDWFDSPHFDYLYHIWVSRVDADARIARALPDIIAEAARLIRLNRGTTGAYPEDLSNQPA